MVGWTSTVVPNNKSHRARQGCFLHFKLHNRFVLSKQMHGRVSSMNNHINYEGSVDVTETETLVSLGALIRVRVVLRQGASCVHGGGGEARHHMGSRCKSGGDRRSGFREPRPLGSALMQPSLDC